MAIHNELKIGDKVFKSGDCVCVGLSDGCCFKHATFSHYDDVFNVVVVSSDKSNSEPFESISYDLFKLINTNG